VRSQQKQKNDNDQSEAARAFFHYSAESTWLVIVAPLLFLAKTLQESTKKRTTG
jgi:hypothetical protein